MEIRLRDLGPRDTPAAQALTATFGWPHRVEDWAQMQALGTGLVAEQDGALVGTAMAWRWGTQAATLGLIGVAGALQGRGIGRKLFARLLADLEGRSLGLHATEAGLALYAGFGFRPVGRVTQYQGVLAAAPSVPALSGGIRLRPAGDADIPAMAALDRAGTGMDRAVLIEALGSGGMVLEADGRIAGFALMRRFGRGWVIGPVISTRDASRVSDAQAMIAALVQGCAGRFVRIDVPDAAGLGGWLLGLGLADAGQVISMLRGAIPIGGPQRVAALASQAFG